MTDWMKMIKNKNWRRRLMAVSSSKCPSEVLAVAIKDKNEEVRFSAATNANFQKCLTEKAVWNTLIRDASLRIREATALTPGCPPEVLMLAIKSKDVKVRHNAVRNHSCPPEVLAMAIRDEDIGVRHRAVFNPSCPPEALAIAIRDKDAKVRRWAAVNPNCPPEALAIAIRSEDAKVRRWAMKNPSFSADKIREILLK